MSIISSTGARGIEPITHPDSDGKRMADNTKQYEWMKLIHNNLESQFASRPDVFLAGDLLWYPDEHSAERAAPDVMLVFGRPKGHRGSYKQWLEEDVPVTVAFEILSPSNDTDEMAKKFYFYDEYGVEEYYIYDPDANKLEVFVRGQATFRQVHDIPSYVSRRMGIRFEMTHPEMTIYGRNGKRFTSFTESQAETQAERSQKEEARRQADEAKREAGEAKRQADDARRRTEEAERQADEAKRQADAGNRRGDEADRQADAAISRAARLVELGRKVRRGQASAEEVAELERLEDDHSLG